MATNHDAVAALPTSGQASKTLVRNILVARMPYVLADSDVVTNLIGVDPDTGAAIIDIVFLGRLFHYDATDTTTANDGITCLVTSDNRRYKLSDGSDVFAYSVLSNSLSAPPGSPSIGDAYLIKAGATGAWSGKSNYIGTYTRRGWEFINFGIGRFVYVESVDTYYHRNAGGTWVAGFGNQTFGSNSVPLSAAINFGKRVIVENQTTNAPPGSPSTGDAYVIGSSPTGAWAGNAAKIAICEDGSTFTIYAPTNGWSAYDKAQNNAYTFTGSAWVSAAGAVIGTNLVATASGSTGFASGSSYTYSSSTPPDTAKTQFQDIALLSYTAKAAGNKLRFTYRFDSSGTGFVAVAALFRDAVSNALDWHRINVAVGGACEFEISAPDASSHNYYVAIVDSGFGAPPDMFRRIFRVEEFG